MGKGGGHEEVPFWGRCRLLMVITQETYVHGFISEKACEVILDLILGICWACTLS